MTRNRGEYLKVVGILEMVDKRDTIVCYQFQSLPCIRSVTGRKISYSLNGGSCPQGVIILPKGAVVL